VISLAEVSEEDAAVVFFAGALEEDASADFFFFLGVDFGRPVP
jgi:hypothetical protein